MAHVNRKEYWVIFVVLALLTVLEVGVVEIEPVASALGKTGIVSSLFLLAVAKAAIVALFYMHLNHDTKIMKLSIALPLSIPAVYAVVLIIDAQVRLLP